MKKWENWCLLLIVIAFITFMVFVMFAPLFGAQDFLTASGFPGYNIFQVKCPVCDSLGLKSKVYPGGSTRTAAYYPPFYDEEGRHHHHDGNITTTYYSCSNGHQWYEITKGSCWCGWKGGDDEIHILPSTPTLSDSVLRVIIEFAEFELIKEDIGYDLFVPPYSSLKTEYLIVTVVDTADWTYTEPFDTVYYKSLAEVLYPLLWEIYLEKNPRNSIAPAYREDDIIDIHVGEYQKPETKQIYSDTIIVINVGNYFIKSSESQPVESQDSDTNWIEPDTIFVKAQEEKDSGHSIYWIWIIFPLAFLFYLFGSKILEYLCRRKP